MTSKTDEIILDLKHRIAEGGDGLEGYSSAFLKEAVKAGEGKTLVQIRLHYLEWALRMLEEARAEMKKEIEEIIDFVVDEYGFFYEADIIKQKIGELK